MTLSSVMFYTGENPYTHEKVYVARSQEEKRRQKSYFFSRPAEGSGSLRRGCFGKRVEEARNSREQSFHAGSEKRHAGPAESRNRPGSRGPHRKGPGHPQKGSGPKRG